MRPETLVQWHDPRGITLTHGLFEAVVAGAALVTLIHAIVGARRGERLGIVLWLAGLFVGLAGELLLRMLPGRYAPGVFAVSFFGGAGSLATALRLPFGVYLAGRAVERGGFGPASGALVGGLILALLDLPANLIADAANLWHWNGSGALLDERWMGSPLAAPLVWLCVGAGLVGVVRAMRGPLSGAWWRGLLLAPVAAAGGISTAALGVLGLSGLVKLGLSPAALTIGALGLAGTALARGRGGAGPDRALLAVALIYVATCLGIAARTWGLTDRGGTLIVAGLVLLNVSLHLGLHSAGGGAAAGGGAKGGGRSGR